VTGKAVFWWIAQSIRTLVRNAHFWRITPRVLSGNNPGVRSSHLLRDEARNHTYFGWLWYCPIHDVQRLVWFRT